MIEWELLFQCNVALSHSYVLVFVLSIKSVTFTASPSPSSLAVIIIDVLAINFAIVLKFNCSHEIRQILLAIFFFFISTGKTASENAKKFYTMGMK